MGIPMRREHRLFSELASFQDAFPQLADAVVEWREEGKDAAGGVRRAMASDDSLEGLLPCSNRGCRSGGFEVDLIFHEMIQAGEAQREGVLNCPGTERPPVLVTDEPRPIEEFYDRLEHEVDDWERKTGKSYSYDGTMSEKLKKGMLRSSGRCPNVLHYVIRLTYRSTSS